MSKDYYKLLGIEKSASAEEVKAAFRRLAHQYHPDKPSGDEAKFKEINEAYQVLGNPQKRQQYDQFGATFDQQGGFGGGMNWEDFMRQARGGGFSGMNFDFGNLDLGDVFGDFFGFGGNSRRSRKNRGSDIQIDLTLDFSQSIFGVNKKVELYKTGKCQACHGNGAQEGTPIETCSTCGGQGQVLKVQRTFIGNIQTAATCPDCLGTGKRAKHPCKVCAGSGVAKQKEEISIEIPAGIEDGSAVRLSGKGNAGSHGGSSGDLYVNIRVQPSQRFTRIGNDLLAKEKISFVDAILGSTIEAQTPDGVVELTIPAGTAPSTRFRLRGKGVRGNSAGDLFIEVEIEIPRKLSRKQRQLLEEFKAEEAN